MEDGWVNQVIMGIALHREGKGVSGEWREARGWVHLELT